MNLYAGSSEHSFELPEHAVDGSVTLDAINQLLDKKLRISDKNLINLNDKKMFLNRNLIYESAASLNGLPNGANQSNGQLNAGNRSNRNHLGGGQLNGNHQLNGQLNTNQLNGNQLNGNQLNGNQLNGNQLNGSQLNGSQISQLNHLTQLNNPQLNGQLNGHLIESKPNNNQIITGNAYSNYPFNVHEPIVTGREKPFLVILCLV